MFLFQDYLTEQAVNLEKNYLAKLTRQLSLEEKKKRPNKKTVEKLESTIAETQGSKVVIEGVIDNIVKLCFVHRYKDISDSIRSEAMLHLSIWIKNYPEYFLKVTFLKYFGWLLSDNSVSVRLQVAKILPHLIVQNHNSKPVIIPPSAKSLNGLNLRSWRSPSMTLILMSEFTVFKF